MPGGSKFMRNPPPPLSLVFPAGVPPEYNIAAQSVHYVQVRPSAAGPASYRVRGRQSRGREGESGGCRGRREPDGV